MSEMPSHPGNDMNAKTPSLRICFLDGDLASSKKHSNIRILPNAASNLGWQVTTGCLDSLYLEDGQVRLLSTPVRTTVPASVRNAAEFDVIWVLGLGNKDRFHDTLQLLHLATHSCRVINNPHALAFWHGKYLQTECGCRSPLKTPSSLASRDPAWLWSNIKARGGPWVFKPPAGSKGVNVQLHQVADNKARAALEQLTAGGSRYCLVQEFIPAIRNGEKRVLLAGGQIVGQYLRRPAPGDFRTNIAQGACASACDLKPEEQAAMTQLAAWLVEQGIIFAGVDLCWPYLMEINLVNPGGLGTLQTLDGKSRGADVLRKVATWVTEKAPSRSPR